jgi:hypothetical protein
VRSVGRLTQVIAFLAVVSFASLLSCSKGNEPSSAVGSWTGYLAFGGSTNGWNTMTIAEDLSCTVVAEISGNHGTWGTYRLRIEGEATFNDNYILGTSVLITRYRPGVDTTVTTGTWSGDFELDSNSAWGAWMARSGGSFTCSGTWMATKQ